MAPTPPAQDSDLVPAVEEGLPRPWRFLTSHAHVMLAVAADPDARVEDIAERVGITTRQALTILRDLEDGGYLQRTQRGRLLTSHAFRHLGLAEPARDPAQFGLFGGATEDEP